MLTRSYGKRVRTGRTCLIAPRPTSQDVKDERYVRFYDVDLAGQGLNESALATVAVDGNADRLLALPDGAFIPALRGRS